MWHADETLEDNPWNLVMTMDHFQIHGWVRVPGAFSADEAAAMREVVWRALDALGIRRDDPATWRKERPDHLQHLKPDPVFRAVDSDRTPRRTSGARRASC
jgi:hypothetical protein